MKTQNDIPSDRDPLTLSLCHLLREMRLRLNLKASYVARKAGFTIATYYNLESGKTQGSLEFYIRAFRAMNIHPSLALVAAEGVLDPRLPLRVDTDLLMKLRDVEKS